MPTPLRQSYRQRMWNEQQDAKPGPDRVHIYLHKDPQYVVVWIKPSGEPHATNGHECGCTASQYGMGCRHRKIIREMGGLEAAKLAAEGEWTPLEQEAKGEVQGVVRECEPQHMEPEPERLNDPYGGSDRGVGGRGGPRGSGGGGAGVVQASNQGGIQEKQRRGRGDKQMSHGYDFEPPKAGGGNYLRLSKDGETVRLRLASEPLIFTEEVKFNDKVSTKTSAAWIVLHKEVVDGKGVVSCKHFKAGMTVYGQIRNLAMDPDWGDPIGYDIEVSRNGMGLETKYTVIPKPNGKPVTEEQQAMIDEASYDLHALYVAKKADNGHSSGLAEGEDPFADD